MISALIGSVIMSAVTVAMLIATKVSDNALNNSLNESVYKDREDGSSIRFITPSKNEFLGNSCFLVNNILRHRVLIKKDDNLGNFNLFTCYLKNETLCPYEVNK